MKHLDLFSGIGGFSLALDRAYHDKKIKHTFVEYDPFCQAVLRKHWPQAEINGNIHAFIADTESQQTNSAKPSRLHTESGSQAGRPFILTGGFPCQPFSQAGLRKGTEDDRYLWPAMLAVITLFKPRWVIAENVAGLVTWNDGLVLETVCTDLEAQGYEVQPFVIPACSVGAPHRRDRVWIVAHSKGGGRNVGSRTDGLAEQGWMESYTKEWGSQGSQGSGCCIRPEWKKDWIEVATRLCRVDDGVPRRLDRNPRLKALGNAIVPQVAEEIFKAIREIE